MMCAGWVGFNASEQAEKPHPSERYKICKRNKTMTLTQGYFPHTDTDGGREGWWAVSHLTPQGPQNRRQRGEWGMAFSPSWLNDSVWLQATLLAAGNSFSGWPTYLLLLWSKPVLPFPLAAIRLYWRALDQSLGMVRWMICITQVNPFQKAI